MCSFRKTSRPVMIVAFGYRFAPAAGKTMNALLAESVFGGWSVEGISERRATLTGVKVLDATRRDAAAARFTLLAVASLGLIFVAVLVPMPEEVRSAAAVAALVGYGHFSGKAVQLWQGRGQPNSRQPVWRRHFLEDRPPHR